MAPGAASPVDSTTAYMPAATTYSSRECQPSPTPECTLWRGTSLSVPSDYITMAEYMEAWRVTYIINDDSTSSTLELVKATTFLSNVNQWRSAISTAMPASIANEDPAIVASSDGLSQEAWVQAMPSDVRRYYLSAYLPQFTTQMVYQEFVAPTRSIVLPSDSTDLKGIVSIESNLAALQITSMTAMRTTTTASTGASATIASSPMVTASTTAANPSGLNEQPGIGSSPGLPGRNKVIAVAVSISLMAVISLICCAVYYCLKQRQRRRRQEPTFEHARRRSMYQIDYNAEPVYPHKPLQHLSDTSFGSTLASQRGSVVGVQDSPPLLPPLPKAGDIGLMLAHGTERQA